MGSEAIQRRLMGLKDSRGTQGIYARGANVYNGGSSAAHSGGGSSFGRPTETPKVNQEPSGEGSMQEVFQQATQGGVVDMNPKPVAPVPPNMEAIQRRLLGGQRGN